MYKNKDKQQEANRESARRYRKGMTQGMTVYPDILDKLTNKIWRTKLERICQSFKISHHPDYINDVWMGDFNLSQVCELLECTA